MDRVKSRLRQPFLHIVSLGFGRAMCYNSPWNFRKVSTVLPLFRDMQRRSNQFGHAKDLSTATSVFLSIQFNLMLELGFSDF